MGFVLLTKNYSGYKIDPKYFGEQVRFVKIQNLRNPKLLKPKNNNRDANYKFIFFNKREKVSVRMLRNSAKYLLGHLYINSLS